MVTAGSVVVTTTAGRSAFTTVTVVAAADTRLLTVRVDVGKVLVLETSGRRAPSWVVC